MSTHTRLVLLKPCHIFYFRTLVGVEERFVSKTHHLAIVKVVKKVKQILDNLVTASSFTLDQLTKHFCESLISILITGQECCTILSPIPSPLISNIYETEAAMLEAAIGNEGSSFAASSTGDEEMMYITHFMSVLLTAGVCTFPTV